MAAAAHGRDFTRREGLTSYVASSDGVNSLHCGLVAAAALSAPESAAAVFCASDFAVFPPHALVSAARRQHVRVVVRIILLSVIRDDYPLPALQPFSVPVELMMVIGSLERPPSLSTRYFICSEPSTKLMASATGRGMR